MDEPDRSPQVDVVGAGPAGLSAAPAARPRRRSDRFLEGRAAQIKRVSEGTARAIDVVVREVIGRNYARASQIPKGEDERILASESNLASVVLQLGGDAVARLAAPCEAGATTVARERI